MLHDSLAFLIYTRMMTVSVSVVSHGGCACLLWWFVCHKRGYTSSATFVHPIWLVLGIEGMTRYWPRVTGHSCSAKAWRSFLWCWLRLLPLVQVMVYTLWGPWTALRCHVTCAPCSDLAQPCYAPGVSRSGRLPNCAAQVSRITGEEGVGFGHYLNEIYVSFLHLFTVCAYSYVRT